MGLFLMYNEIIMAKINNPMAIHDRHGARCISHAVWLRKAGPLLTKSDLPGDGSSHSGYA